MWLLKLKSNLEITEAQVQCWDNVPTHVVIVALAFSIKRQEAPPYILEMKAYEQYCVEKIASGVSSGTGKIVGYSLSGIKESMVFKVEIYSAGMKFVSYPRSLSKVPDRCWRKGA